jgi:hypothetical protein
VAPVRVSAAFARKITGEKIPPKVCDGCGRAKAACECLELALIQQLRFAGLPAPARQVRAVPGRYWRWDLGYPDRRLLIEVHGGHRGHGAHSRAEGATRDAEKQNAATLAGWRCLVVTGEMVEDGRALALVEQALGGITQ